MSRPCSEPDWRVYREVSADAIERCGQRALDEIATIAQDADRQATSRLAAVAGLSRPRRSTVDHEYSELARSRVLTHVAAMQAHDLFRPDEIAGFSKELQASLRLLAEYPASGERRRRSFPEPLTLTAHAGRVGRAESLAHLPCDVPSELFEDAL